MNPLLLLFLVGIVGSVVGWSIGLGIWLSREKTAPVLQGPHYRRRKEIQFTRLGVELMQSC